METNKMEISVKGSCPPGADGNSDKDKKPSAEGKSAMTGQIFHLLGTDCLKNMDIILEQSLEIIQGFCSLYVPWESKQKKPLIKSKLYPDLILDRDLFPENGIFRDTRTASQETNIVIPCIMPRDKAASDPLVKKYGIKACLGTPVFFQKKPLGFLWILDTCARTFTIDDNSCIQNLAAAMGLEQERLFQEKHAVLVCMRDISRIKELEEKLKQAEKMELLGIVAGGVAHDLNNILSGLVSYPELLLMQLEKGNPLKEAISFMHDTGLQAANIAQDLLALTRRGIHQTSIVNLNKMIYEYFHSSTHLRLEKKFPGISFIMNLEDELLNIKGSETHISKIIMNLVRNAAEAVDKKGRVTIETLNRYFHLDIPGNDEIQEGQYVILRVSDDGEGIEEKDINRIFEPFYTKKQMGRSGSGLGLSVVWNSVQDHQGYIKVFSEEQQDTRFELYFPATQDTPQKIPDDFYLDAFREKNETVLVIDDDEGQRKITQECLTMLGYTPFAVDSGKKALAFLKTQPVDLLILDMKMAPGINGLETYKKVLAINPDQKAFIVSGLSETRQIKEALHLGVGQYIKKPYTVQKLAIALKKELGHKT